ncbi:MAG: AraC family transcriptional regulator [Burkholderiales bacterium]|nr:AraC family transcriptional regulator [Burkholderiales bacterium]
MPEPITSPERARLIAPRMALASCVRAYLTRDTASRPLLLSQERFNHFPASPLCSITWLIEGESFMVDAVSGRLGQKVARALFAGPQTRPTVSYNPGPVRAIMVLFYPHAFHQLSSVDVSTCVDKLVALDEVLGDDWRAMSDAVLTAPDDAERVRHIEQFLLPRWQQVDERGNAIVNWVRRLAVQAAAAGWGRSARNLERRIRTWAGQPMRTLQRMYRAEQSFLDARDEMIDATVSWADVAQRAGYADQAHFCRETREITGLSPTGLARAGREEESYWVYRVWS